MKPSDDSNEPTYGSETEEHDLETLLSAYLEGDLDDDQWQYLESKKHDTEFNLRWQDGLQTHTALMVAMEPEAAEEEKIIPLGVALWKTTVGKLALSAAAIVIGLLVFQAVNQPAAPTQTVPLVAQIDSFHAIVIGSESTDPNQLREGTFLPAQTIEMKNGWASIQTLRGVTLTLQAPFEAKVVSTDNIELVRGAARVHVPSGAEGFHLTTPNMEILDIGNEFAVEIGEDGIERCRVFGGEADVSLVDSEGKSISKKRLTASQSVRSNQDSTHLVAIEENDKDYHEIIIPPRPNLALQQVYPMAVTDLNPLGYWRFESVQNSIVRNEIQGGVGLRAVGTAGIAEESGGNHSGQLNDYHETELFALNGLDHKKLSQNFTFSLYFQMDWLQNYALISASHYGKQIQGYAFLMQAYADFDRSGLHGTGPHAVLRDPPAWEGGDEIFGNKLLKPLHWHHMATTREGDTITIYLDGKKVGSEKVGDKAMDFRTIFVGRMTSNPDLTRTNARGLVGYIDELAIFDRALTADEIKTLASGQQ